MINDIYINGTSLNHAYGVIVSGGGAFNSATRDTNEVEVLGTRGKIMVDNGRWLPCALEYDCGVVGQSGMDGIRAFMASLGGSEFTVADTYHPDEHYLCTLNGGFSVTPAVNNKLFKFKLAFTRRPQRYLAEISDRGTVAAGGTVTVHNRTLFPMPIMFRLTSSSTSATVTATNSAGTWEMTAPGMFNSDTWTAVDGSGIFIPVNSIVSGEPYFQPGTTRLTFSAAANYSFTGKPYTM